MIIDFNAHFGAGPGMPATYSPEELLRLLKSAGIDRAVVADLGSAFGEQTTHQPTPEGLVRFEAINAEADLERLAGLPIKGVRIYPTYHHWDLQGDAMRDLLHVAKERGLVVQICLRLQDPRVLPQRIASAQVIEALDEMVEPYKNVRFVLSGATYYEVAECPELFKRGNVWTDISHVQHPTNSLLKLMGLIGTSRVIFGSNAPIFYPYHNVYRVLNSQLGNSQRESILWESAAELLG